MSILIYTYHDPYKIDKEKFWDEIQDCPYFCAAQTLINGLSKCYKNFFSNDRAATVKKLTDALFPFWTSTSTVIKQHADIDNIINEKYNSEFNNLSEKNILSAFRFNRDEVFKSIRTLFELKINIDEIVKDKITVEQEYLLKIFENILESNSRKNFELKDDFFEFEINEALINALSSNNKEIDTDALNMDTVVIHGVHQFTPLILRTIEEISKYKKVILLFNYQSQYKEIYQTWIDVYSAFESSISIFDGVEFIPQDKNSISYEGNVLANNIGKLVCGGLESIETDRPNYITEFDNITEFAGYVANIFEDAKKEDNKFPIGKMKEQIYSADTSVNDILKIYFPEQFGERQFLNYPLGHFFVAIANMWDPDLNQINITKLEDIEECLGANILNEDEKGKLLSIFIQAKSLFVGCKTLDEMIKRIKRLKKNNRRISNEKIDYVKHISYYSLSRDDIDILEEGLNDLKEIAELFYSDFERKPNNFKIFYKRLKQYLKDDILDGRELDNEFADIVKRVLERLDEVDEINTTASFDCLRATMSIYLTQETKPGKSANWIVRGFDQIEGDILRSKTGNPNVIYHFACLTDEDINAINRSEFTWPLNDNFFEIAQNPIDWKYQVFVKSRKEFKNFNRFALIYGLEFNRARFKLSYIKHDRDREKEPYYLLKILGFKKIPYVNSRKKEFIQPININSEKKEDIYTFRESDIFRYRMCKYRFLLESITEGTTIYKDEFLLMKYFEVILENELKIKMAGNPFNESIMMNTLNDIYDEFSKYFPFAQNINRMDAINSIRTRMLKNKYKVYPEIDESEDDYLEQRKLFIHNKLSDKKNGVKNALLGVFDTNNINNEKNLNSNLLYSDALKPLTGVWCQYCANKNICVEEYNKEGF